MHVVRTLGRRRWNVDVLWTSMSFSTGHDASHLVRVVPLIAPEVQVIASAVAADDDDDAAAGRQRRQGAGGPPAEGGRCAGGLEAQMTERDPGRRVADAHALVKPDALAAAGRLEGVVQEVLGGAAVDSVDHWAADRATLPLSVATAVDEAPHVLHAADTQYQQRDGRELIDR